MNGLVWLNTGLAVLSIGLEIIGLSRDVRYHSRYAILRMARLVFLFAGYSILGYAFVGVTVERAFAMAIGFTFLLICLSMRGVYEFFTRA